MLSPSLFHSRLKTYTCLFSQILPLVSLLPPGLHTHTHTFTKKYIKIYITFTVYKLSYRKHVCGGTDPPPRKSPTRPPEIFCRPQFLERVIPYVAVRIQEETRQSPKPANVGILPRPLAQWGWGHPLPTPYPLGAFGSSKLAPSALALGFACFTPGSWVIAETLQQCRSNVRLCGSYLVCFLLRPLYIHCVSKNVRPINCL